MMLLLILTIIIVASILRNIQTSSDTRTIFRVLCLLTLWNVQSTLIQQEHLKHAIECDTLIMNGLKEHNAIMERMAVIQSYKYERERGSTNRLEQTTREYHYSPQLIGGYDEDIQ